MARTLTDALRDFDDSRLLELLTARQDLNSPAPTSLAALAAKAAGSASVHKALQSLRRPELHLAEVFAAFGTQLSPQQLAQAVSATTEQIAPHLYRLATLGLIFSSADGRQLIPVRNLLDAIPHPAGLAPVLSNDPSLEQAEQIVAQLPLALEELAQQLAFGPGRVQGSPDSKLAKALIKAKIVQEIKSAQGVRLLIPRTVHLQLRGGVLHRNFQPFPTPQQLIESSGFETARDTEAREAALQAVRIVDSLEHMQTDPPQVLKRGGMPLRDAKRCAASLQVDLDAWNTVMHAAWVDSLLGHDGETWQVTQDFAQFAQLSPADQWAELVQVWLGSNYLGSIAGTKSPLTQAGTAETNRAAFSLSVGRPGVKVRRKLMLQYCADFADFEITASELTNFLNWAFPLQPVALMQEEAEAFLSEAAAFGLLLHGSLTSLGLTAAQAVSDAAQSITSPATLASSTTELSSVLSTLLPPVVEQLILDADLSIMVPGLPAPSVEAILQWSEVLSRGSSIQARFTPQSVTAALSAGELAEPFLQELSRLSLTGVPQPLEYLIRDEARKMGRVQIARAQSVITSDAEYLDRLELEAEQAGLVLNRVAPTVLLAQSDPGFLMQLSRKAGLSPIAMSADGSLAPAFPGGSLHGGPLPLETEADTSATEFKISAEEALTQIRAGEAGELEAVSVAQRLLAAIADEQVLQVGIVDGRGATQVLWVKPLALEGGKLRAVEVTVNGGGIEADGAVGKEFTVLLHRVLLP